MADPTTIQVDPEALHDWLDAERQWWNRTGVGTTASALAALDLSQQLARRLLRDATVRLPDGRDVLLLDHLGGDHD